ncbi:MAG: hemolysin [Planctomycetota bacterium]|nr:MAG: hemolysin [Planctomycetota bacterium]
MSDPQDPATRSLASLATAPTTRLTEGRYEVRFARTAEDLHSALALRYRIFNLELNEGLDASHLTGLDEDGFDAACHHLLLEHTGSGEIVGTYRLQTAEMAAAHQGFYSDGEFRMGDLGPEILAQGVELGRACISAEHRNQKALFGLWRGLAAYLVFARRRYLFGCCSLTSQDQDLALAAAEHLRVKQLVWPDLHVSARAPYRCSGAQPDARAVKAVSLPRLFRTYLRFGAYVCSEPAIDRAFGTIDFIVLMDTKALPERSLNTFFGDARPW